jgi:hypothetical protein
MIPIICVSGFSGSGKDEFSDYAVSKFDGVKAGITDKTRRFLIDMYGFSEEQMFGSSEMRNKGDMRIPKDFWKSMDRIEEEEYICIRPKGLDEITMKMNIGEFKKDGNDGSIKIKKGDPRFWLSPREALQKHCAQFDNLCSTTQIESAISISHMIEHRFTYTREYGIGATNHRSKPYNFIVFSDFRHAHEFEFMKSGKIGRIKPIFIRIKRSGVEVPPYDHRSETEQAKISDMAFEFIIENDRNIEHLHNETYHIINQILSNKIEEKEWKSEYFCPTWDHKKGYMR